MPVSFTQRSKPVIHAALSDEVNTPYPDQPFDPRFKLDARIRAECIEIVAIDALKPNPKNAKKHPEHQIARLEENIEEFGYTNPILIDENNQILCGHARYAAAKRLGFSHLPVIRHSHLTPAQKRAMAVADNKLAELGEWDFEILTEELEFLSDPVNDLSFDPRITGFDTVEIDQILNQEAVAGRADPADKITQPNPDAEPITTVGDMWIADQHLLLCADAKSQDSYDKLMGLEQAQMVFTNPPDSLPNAGHVSKREGAQQYLMARGEMTSGQFTEFLSRICGNIRACLAPGAVSYICIDWRYLMELRGAADPAFGQLKNTVVWVKPNARMGSFYRSAHELILVYTAPGQPINNFGRGAKGCHRTNVWNYQEPRSSGRGRNETLAMHPTVKPIAMVADALKDCSNRGGIVLDPFAGSGTTMIAAERTGRRARLMETDPLYCDLIVMRWQKLFGKAARLAETNEKFEEVSARRANEGVRS